MLLCLEFRLVSFIYLVVSRETGFVCLYLLSHLVFQLLKMASKLFSPVHSLKFIQIVKYPGNMWRLTPLILFNLTLLLFQVVFNILGICTVCIPVTGITKKKGVIDRSVL